MKKILVALITGLVLSVTGVVFSGCNTKEYKISFMVDGEEFVYIKTNGNEIVAMPDIPTKEGYVFLGWYLDNEVWEQPFTSITLFIDAIEEDIKVYSKWGIKCTKGLTYELNEEKTGYVLTDTGTAMEENIIIPIEHNNLPVVAIKHKAFNNCTWLTSITIPNSVTSIGAEAFYNCSSLEAIEIPDSVTSIGSSAFYNCSSLTKVNYLGTIDEWVQIEFASTYSNPLNCAKNLYINNELVTEAKILTTTKINDYAFSDCSSLTSIEIPESVTSIGNSAFYSCDELTSVTIPNNVTSIGSDAFYGCSSLTNVTIGSGIRNIDKNAFRGCVLLTTIILPNSVTSIGEYAFYNCSALTSIIIPERVTSIGNYAFRDCYSLTSITISNSVTSIGYGAFSDCPIEYATIPTIAVGEIDKTNLKEIIINGGKSIGNSAFYSCDELTSVTIGNSVTSIGEYAFYNCSALTSIIIPESVTSISYGAFSDCPIEYATIPTIAIGEIDKTNLKEVIINGGESIGNSAFYSCDELTSVTIGNSITSIGHYAFYYCTSLTSVTIPNNVTSIGSVAFSYCTSLTSVTIGNSVTSIGVGAFYYCTSLTSVTIPNNVISIGSDAFYGCSSLTSITIGNSVTSIGEYAFYNCSALTSIIIPNSVTSIGNYAFRDCSKLTIYCEAESKPSGWDSSWNISNRPVVWGYKGNNLDINE